MFEALGFFVSERPLKADHIGEQLLRETMAQHKMVRDLLPFRGEIDATAATNAKIAAARHALQRRGDCRRSDFEILSKSRADRYLFLLDEFPDGFQVVFLRYAGFLAAQSFDAPSNDARTIDLR